MFLNERKKHYYVQWLLHLKARKLKKRDMRGFLLPVLNAAASRMVFLIMYLSMG